MIWHCGLLDDHPERHPTHYWTIKGSWGMIKWPPEIEKEVQIWLAMPGFPLSFHTHTLQVGRMTVQHHLGFYDRWKTEVAENWASATRDDCIRLSRMRPGTGHIPIICQMQMLDDVKRGMTQQAVADEYRVAVQTVTGLVAKGVRWPFGVSLHL